MHKWPIVGEDSEWTSFQEVSQVFDRNEDGKKLAAKAALSSGKRRQWATKRNKWVATVLLQQHRHGKHPPSQSNMPGMDQEGSGVNILSMLQLVKEEW